MQTLDLVVLIAYIAVVVGVGFFFARRSGTSDGFMKAGGRLPGWVIGLSLFGTYLSSRHDAGGKARRWWQGNISFSGDRQYLRFSEAGTENGPPQ